MRRYLMIVVFLMISLVALTLTLPVKAQEDAPASPAPTIASGDETAGYHWVATWGDAAPVGVFYFPEAIAADGDGNVYVADTGSHRIQVFTSNGTFVRTFGRLGSGNGEFYGPAGIAVLGDRVYVADYHNSRGQVFTRSGAFVRSVGHPGGFDDDSLFEPSSIGVSRAGQTYLFDLRRGRVTRFSATGLLEAYHQLDYPGDLALAVGAAGEFYYPYAFGGVNRVALDGTLTRIGSETGQPGYIENAGDLTCAPDGSLWVHNLKTEHVFHYSATGAFLGSFPVTGWMLGIAATANRVYVLTSAPQVVVYNWVGQQLDAWGSGTSLMFYHPDRLAAAPDGTFYVLERFVGRIRHLDGAGNILGTLTPVGGQGNLVYPKDIAVDGWGRLYVLEEGYNERIKRFVDGRFDATFSMPIENNYVQSSVNAIAISGDFLFYVKTIGLTTQTSLNGVYLNDWLTGSSSASFIDIELTSTGQMFRLDRYYPPVIRGTTFRGLATTAWGSHADTALAPGNFVYPSGLAPDQRGRLFVLDTDNRERAPYQSPLYGSRVQAFSESGQYVFTFGSFGSGQGQLASAQALIALSDGRVVVADTGNNRLQVFAPDDPLPPRVPLPAPITWPAPLPPLPMTWQDQGPVGSSAPTEITVPLVGSPQNAVTVRYGGEQSARSSDGVHWSRQPFNLPVKRFHGSLVYAGASTLVVSGDWDDTAYRSTDGGQTWTRLGDAIAFGPKSIVASPTFDDDGILFAAAYRSGFWRSTDRGDTWGLRNLAGRRIDRLKVASNAQGARVLLIVDYENQILRSTDDGLSWQPTGLRDRSWPAFSPTFAQDQTAFALSSYLPELSRSTDSGITWHPVAAHNLQNDHDSWRGLVLSPFYATDHTLAIWTSRQGYLSTDGGENWALLGPMSNDHRLIFIAFAPDYAISRRMWWSQAGRGDGFMMTTDGGATWQVPQDGLPGTAVTDLLGEANTPWAATPDGLLVKSRTDRDWTWLPGVGAQLIFYHRALAQSSTFGLDGTALVSDQLTTDGGQTWRPIPAELGLEPDSSSAAAFAPDFIHSRLALVAWKSSDSAWGGAKAVVSVDGAVTWQIKLLPALSPYPRVALIVNRGAQAHRFFVGGDGGLVFSDDHGQTWTLTGAPVRIQSVVGLVTMNEGGATILYAATKPRGVWRSTDLGVTWSEFNRRLPNGHACALDADRDLLVVGLCDGGVYVWRAAPPGWEPLGAPLPGGVASLLVQRGLASGTLWAATAGGIYKTNLFGLPSFETRWFPLIP
ncbi:MAG: hypothetical protein WAV79_14940 [Anaerolineae bacterium]